jgi:hypothetical protein
MEAVMRFDPELEDGCTVRVRNHGQLNAEERRFIGKTGHIVRSYVASCRVDIGGTPIMFPKVALELVTP